MMGRGVVVRRRRPLLRAAAVGGTYAAGRAMGRRAEQQASAQAAGEHQGSAAGDVRASPPGSAHGDPASSEALMMDQLSRLSMLHQQGALTDDEFAAAKAKVIGG